VKAYLTAHGTDPDAVDEEVFNDICVLYHDGLIGNTGIIETLGNLTAGVYNYLRSANAPAYKLKDIIPTIYDYIYPPVSDDNKRQDVNNKLIAFALLNPGAPKQFFGNK